MSAGGGLLSKPKPFGDSSYSVQLEDGSSREWMEMVTGDDRINVGAPVCGLKWMRGGAGATLVAAGQQLCD